MFDKKLKKDFLSFLLLSVILLFVAGILTNMLGFWKTGFESELVLKQYWNYGIVLMIGWAICFMGFIYEMVQKKGDEKYGNTLFFDSKGEQPSLPFFQRFNNFRLFLLSTIVFGVLGLIAVFRTQVAYTGVPQLMVEQQFTPASSVLYNALLITIAENMGAMALIVIIVVLLRILARRKDWSTKTFHGFLFLVVPIAVGLFGVANHSLRYAGIDIALIIVFFFWMLGSILTLITGSFIPFLMMHVFNNFYIDIARYFSAEVILPIVIFAFIVLIGIYIFYTVRHRRRGI